MVDGGHCVVERAVTESTQLQEIHGQIFPAHFRHHRAGWVWPVNTASAASLSSILRGARGVRHSCARVSGSHQFARIAATLSSAPCRLPLPNTPGRQCCPKSTVHAVQPANPGRIPVSVLYCHPGCTVASSTHRSGRTVLVASSQVAKSQSRAASASQCTG